MTVDGWIPVDPLTLETPFPGVYAVGDVAAVGTPRAGVFAEGQAAVAAEHIAARIRARRARPSTAAAASATSSSGSDQVAQVDVTFFGDQRTGELVGPSEASWPTRPSSARAGSSAGSGGSGPLSERVELPFRRPQPRGPRAGRGIDPRLAIR